MTTRNLLTTLLVVPILWLLLVVYTVTASMPVTSQVAMAGF